MNRFKKTVSRNYYPLHISGELYALQEGIHEDDFFWRPHSFLVVRHASKLCACFEELSPPANATNFEALFSNLPHLVDIFSRIAKEVESGLSFLPGSTREDAMRLYGAFKLSMTRMLMSSRVAFMMKNLLPMNYALTEPEQASLFRPYRKPLLSREIAAIRQAQEHLLRGGNAHAEAQKLADEYGWIHSEYRGRAWETVDYISEITRPPVFPEPEHLVVPNIPEDIHTIAGLLTYIHDEGKSGVVRANWALRETLKNLGEDETLILAATQEEFLQWGQTGARPSEELRTRINEDLGMFLDGDIVSHFFGTEKVSKLISDLDLTSYFQHPSWKGGIITGTTAYRGKVQGRVRIIFNQKDSESLVEGEILVASMTTPELVAGMRKAAAFITDEGGITCHAAILARELHKPCIVGTKIATQVLKNGDIVEVDAEKGMVRRL